MKATLFVSHEFADEAMSLLETAGYEVEKTYPLPSRPNRLYYIPQDKVKLLQEQKTDAVVVFDLLSPRHFINLNRSLSGKKVLDKLLLLLEIFALHAGSKEAKLQIELARLKYELPIIKDIYSKTKNIRATGTSGCRYLRRRVHVKTLQQENIEDYERARGTEKVQRGTAQEQKRGVSLCGNHGLHKRREDLDL